jgi:hypothetical protein
MPRTAPQAALLDPLRAGSPKEPPGEATADAIQLVRRAFGLAGEE